jgi:hypothetical protein
VVIFRVCFEMFGKLVDPLRQQRNLYFRRTGIGFVRPVIGNRRNLGRFRNQLCSCSLMLSVGAMRSASLTREFRGDSPGTIVPGGTDPRRKDPDGAVVLQSHP